jgi:hypothetical protein
MLELLKNKLAELRARRDARYGEGDQIAQACAAETRSTTADEDAALAKIVEDVRALDAEITSIEAEVRDIEVIAERRAAVPPPSLIRPTDKPAEVRMGKGKGAVEYWAARVHPGRIMFEIDGVPIPFASPELLWRMKCRAGREKDRGDIEFLRQYFAAKGIVPPDP